MAEIKGNSEPLENRELSAASNTSQSSETKRKSMKRKLKNWFHMDTPVRKSVKKKRFSKFFGFKQQPGDAFDVDVNDPKYALLKQFLSGIGLEAYIPAFVEAGFRSMDDLEYILFEDLINMEVPRIHARRMMKAIEERGAKSKG